jgi:anti-sigma28 factor (negative regulator of flagellin synthesis)
MRVDDRNLTNVPTTESGRTQETQRSSKQDAVQSTSGSEGGAGDQVELSSTLGSLSRAMSAYGSNRNDRIDEIATQYRDGTYQPNPVGTSQGLISEALAAGVR